ncbi:MAG: transglutaminase family protein [Opitutaceae bacterium]|nr:transglutaminase family protein [Opitutaceae bacterium]
MFLRLTHLTRYDYSAPVSFAPHALYLRPRESPRQRLHEFSLTICPAARRIATNDPLDNALDWAYFAPDTTAARLEFRSELMVETLDENPFDFFLRPAAIAFPFAYEEADRLALAPCLALRAETSPADLRAWLAANLPAPPGDTVQMLTALNRAVRQALRYTRREEAGIQPVADTLARGSGSCRDYAVFLIELCRHLGLAARFVSGYLHEPPDPMIANPLPPTTHAWVEVYLPGGGWRGLDPTRGIFCNDAYVPVAHAAVAESVSPVQGGFFGQRGVTSRLTIQLTVERL